MELLFEMQELESLPDCKVDRRPFAVPTTFSQLNGVRGASMLKPCDATAFGYWTVTWHNSVLVEEITTWIKQAGQRLIYTTCLHSFDPFLCGPPGAGNQKPLTRDLICQNTRNSCAPTPQVKATSAWNRQHLGGVWDRNHREIFFNPFSCVRFQVSSLSWEDVQRQISLWLGRKQDMDVVHIGSWEYCEPAAEGWSIQMNGHTLLGPYICIIFGEQEVCTGVPGTGLKVFLFVCKLAVIPGFRWPKDGLNGIFASFGIEPPPPPPPPATTGDPAAGATASSYTGNQKGSSQTTSSQNQRRHWGWRLSRFDWRFFSDFFLCWSWLQHFLQTW